MNNNEKLRRIHSNSVDDTTNIAANFASRIDNDCRVVLLKGNLGAGKTTFIKGFATHYGIKPSDVKSPTYTYIRTYQGLNKKIVHIDLYRMENLNIELFQELQEYLDDKNNFLLIEWPEKIDGYLPLERFEVLIEKGKELTQRELTISYENN